MEKKLQTEYHTMKNNKELSEEKIWKPETKKPDSENEVQL